jgi:hypothetical protein
VAEIISVYSDPGQDFATIKARPLAQIASTRHVMLIFENQDFLLPDADAELSTELENFDTSDIDQTQAIAEPQGR